MSCLQTPPLSAVYMAQCYSGGCRAIQRCRTIFTGFNVRSFRGSAAIHEHFVREYLNVTVNEHAHCYSQSMTSRVAKMATQVYARLLLPVTSQNMDRRCRRKSVQMHEIVRGTWPTVSVPLFIATTNGSSLLLLSPAQPSLSPMKGVHTSS